MGRFGKAQIVSVPGNDPARWYNHRGVFHLGEVEMFDWIVPGQVLSRM
jgi:hypothetical protein